MNEEQQTRLMAKPPQHTNDRDRYVTREEYLISQTHQPVDIKSFFRKDNQADGSVQCKVCVEINGAEWCVVVDCEDIVIKKPKVISQ